MATVIISITETKQTNKQTKPFSFLPELNISYFLEGTLKSWGPWSRCSKYCDTGLQQRHRECLRTPCQGRTVEFRLCKLTSCPGNGKRPQNRATNVRILARTRLFSATCVPVMSAYLVFVIYPICLLLLSDICKQRSTFWPSLARPLASAVPVSLGR